MKVMVVGLGYVGSIAAAGIAAAGHHVLGVDVDRRKVEGLQQAEPLLYEPGLAPMIRKGLCNGNLSFVHTDDVVTGSGFLAPDVAEVAVATKDLQRTDSGDDAGRSVRARLIDVFVIATGTPSLPNGAADLTQVREAIEFIKQVQPSGGIIVMKSTVPPGTGQRFIEQHLAGTPFLYASSPEFLREGQAVTDWFNPDRIVIGAEHPEVMKVAKQLYQGIDAPVLAVDIVSAELIKYAANAFLATKISFINEIAAICELVGGDVEYVAKGIGLDERIGPSFLKAGLGYGGSCFPKDVRALDYISTANGHSFELLRAVITVNNRQRLAPFRLLKTAFGSLNGLEVTVLGLTFKPHTDDMREAPSIELVHLLMEAGALVRAYDPVATAAAKALFPKTVRIFEEPLDALSGAQAAILTTEWPQIVSVDWEEVHTLMRSPHFLFDGRNALSAERLLNMGFDYHAVGRSTPRSSASR